MPLRLEDMLTDLTGYRLTSDRNGRTCYKCGASALTYQYRGRTMQYSEGYAIDSVCHDCGENLPYDASYNGATVWATEQQANPYPRPGTPFRYNAYLKFNSRLYEARPGSSGYMDLYSGSGRMVREYAFKQLSQELLNLMFKVQGHQRPYWFACGALISSTPSDLVWDEVPIPTELYSRHNRMFSGLLPPGQRVGQSVWPYVNQELTLASQGRRSRVQVLPLNRAAAQRPLPWRF